MSNKRNHKQRSSRSASPRDKQDRRPDWWRTLAQRMDLIGRLAERLEPGWQRWWVPVVLLSFPVLLLLLAFVVTTLR